MEVKLQDYYGQHIFINNETSSGNIRFKVRTMKNINDLANKKESECEIETDVSFCHLSLNENHLDIIIGTLCEMKRQIEEY